MLCVILSAHTGFFVSCSSCFCFFFDAPDPMPGAKPILEEWGVPNQTEKTNTVQEGNGRGR